jgi:Ca2+-binding EF-hand superfamily protein
MKLSSGEETILKGQVLQLAQLIGQNPTAQQINDAIESCELSDKIEMSLDDCYEIIWWVWYDIDVKAELREAFSKFDKDKNGYLDVNEFRTAMQSLGETLTDDELAEMMALVDTNNDGKISYEGTFLKIKYFRTLFNLFNLFSF